ncbi:hypothetical protein [Burkholderia lata]|uniref:hypothetical protein n=1 Tax=Burkholderia lata (strain ATCC 17760 / DSM 23089 / LMG 22485 / NCIMB 9086 / R18194 / 383) TaxID=482957 RepID=UPI00243159BD|nr:hypothetical protein [Burkholderia lata]
MIGLFHFVTVKPGIGLIKPENITVPDFLWCEENERFSSDAAINSRILQGAIRFFRSAWRVEAVDAEWMVNVFGEVKCAGVESFSRIELISIFR